MVQEVTRYIKKSKVHLALIAGIFVLTFTGSAFLFMTPFPSVHTDEEQKPQAQKSVLAEEPPLAPVQEKKPDIATSSPKRVIIYLEKMTLELREGDTVTSLPILSKGKPGSYYETIGGNYRSDYKEKLHFSSIGHVYMPYSIHLFGNYFIHGIPYYPDGKQVSSEYSGGCIRLRDEHAKQVYDFISKGTPIIMVQNNEQEFDNLPSKKEVFLSEELTRMMVAAISLEVLAQDAPITDTDGITETTRKKVLPRLLIQDDKEVALLYAEYLGEPTFVGLMNQKAKALGMTSTHFEDVTSPSVTSYEDYERFMQYISTYKSYIRKTIQSGL